MKSLVIKFGSLLPEWLLHVTRDPVGERTWVEWLRNSPVRISMGYKRGGDIDRVYWRFFGVSRLRATA